MTVVALNFKLCPVGAWGYETPYLKRKLLFHPTFHIRGCSASMVGRGEDATLCFFFPWTTVRAKVNGQWPAKPSTHPVVHPIQIHCAMPSTFTDVPRPVSSFIMPASTMVCCCFCCCRSAIHDRRHRACGQESEISCFPVTRSLSSHVALLVLVYHKIAVMPREAFFLFTPQPQSLRSFCKHAVTL